MIGQFLLDIVFGIVTGILELFNLSDIAWDVGSGTLASFMSIVSSICYFLPMDTVSTIVGLIVSFGIFRAAIRLITTLWDLLPIV